MQFETVNSDPNYSDQSGLFGIVTNSTGTSLGVTSIADRLDNSWAKSKGSKILANPLLGQVVGGAGLYNAAGDLGANYETNDWAQNADAVSGLVSGSGSFAIGSVGLVESAAWGTASITGSLGETGLAVIAAATVGPEIALAAAVTVAAASVYGITNEISKVGSGKSMIEHSGDAGEALANFNDHSIFDMYDQYQSSGAKKKAQMREVFKNMEERKRYAEWKSNLPKINLRPQIITINLKNDCPPNNSNGGTQKPNPKGSNPGTLDSTQAVAPKDPNEIIGPNGQPNKHWVSVKDRLPYTILFENDTTASAPAKFVRVTSPIEPKQDAATFQLGNFGFNNQTFVVPPNTASYYQRLDCKDSLGLYVDITAGYDQINNVAFWEFQSIDPITLLSPSDPLKGFLLLQDSTQTNYGHGLVNFSIKPLQSAITLDTIGARATIVFDTNDTIPTNIAMNTIDAFAPTSHMNILPANSNNPVTLSWGGVDDPGGCGLKFYTLYVSTDGINFNIIRNGITRTDTTFIGAPTTMYYFFVLATDSVGNTEVLRPGEVRSTFIGGVVPITWLYFKGFNQGKDNLLQWATASEQNSKEFIVERSLTGNNFSSIASIAAAGNSSTTKNYQYKDENIDKLNSTVMYYRLKQLDINSSLRYSNIVRLNYKQTEISKSIVYPNPTQGLIMITIADKALLGTIASLFDESGKMLESIKITANSQSVNLNKYVNGIYFIRLSNKEILKVIKQ